MTIAYRRTQVGYVILAVFGGILGLIAVLMITAGAPPPDLLALLTLVILVPVPLIAVAFGTLTVTVDAEAVWIRFGPCVIRKRFPIRDIVSCRAVWVPWYSGWGIRWTGDGWLYNVSGLRAVELRTRHGKRYLIGTDRPEELEAAIRQAAAPAGVLLSEPVEPAQLTGWRRWLPAALVASVVVLVLAMMFVPQYMLGYELSDEGITVRLATTRLFLPRAEITDASVIRYTLRWRVFGTSAVRYHSGWFDVDPVGRIRAYANRRAGEGVLLVLHNGERVLLTPPEPESFVRHLEGRR